MQAFEKAPPDIQEILTKPIKELGLKLEGSHARALRAPPVPGARTQGTEDNFGRLCYLTDEWGCPSGEPVIGIPFYLADPKLARLEKQMNDLEDEREILMYLRHEAGHAFNYAYELYKTPEWRDLFGPFRRPYRDDYRPIPFSRALRPPHRRLVCARSTRTRTSPRPSPCGSRRARSGASGTRDWPALAKLRYVDRMAHRCATRSRCARTGHTDLTVDEMETTVADFYQASARRSGWRRWSCRSTRT